MIDVRKFDTLGHADHGWLNARHHFSFADYHDPGADGLGRDPGVERRRDRRQLRLPAASRTATWRSSPMSARGAITHQDSMGNKGRTAAGDVQVMSAGTGVRHAEYNLEDEATTLFQIWVLTDQPDAEPELGRDEIPEGRPLGPVRDPGERLRRGCRGAEDQCGRPGDGRDAEGGRDGRAFARPGAPRLSGRGAGRRSRSTASAPSRATASPSPARTKVTIKALDDAEIVLVDAR